ncbi:MAG: F0F1 ATP synthase subunit epsilon [Desulfobacterota bacterium]|nr:F0F1 ATP synthase subunit epsilon [Thermodesulfobacteriota bacterium]
MGDSIYLNIFTPEKVVFADSAEAVTAPGTIGEFGVLPGHAALVSTLEVGEVVIKKDNREYFGASGGGIAEVVNDKVTILTPAAELAQEIDIKRAEAAKLRAEERLKNLPPEDDQHTEILLALKRAQNRIKTAERKSV